MLKVQLVNNDFGELIVGREDFVDPLEINKLKKLYKRSELADGVIYQIIINLQFAKLARRYIQNVFELRGPEGVILVNIYQDDPNARTQELYFTGRIKLTNYDIDSIIVESSIEQTGFEVKVANRLDVDVDLESLISQGGQGITPVPLVDVLFHAKLTKEEFEAKAIGLEYQQLSVINFSIPFLANEIYREAVVYCGIDNSEQPKKELEDTFTTPFGYSSINSSESGQGNLGIDDEIAVAADYIAFLTRSDLVPFGYPFHVAKFSEVIDLELSLRLRHEIHVTNSGGDVDICDDGALGRREVYAWYEHRSAAGITKEIVNVGKWDDIEGCGQNDAAGAYQTMTLSRIALTLEPGDKLLWYCTYRITGRYDNNGLLAQLAHDFNIQADPEFTFQRVTANTTFLGSGATTKGILVHEAFEKIAQYITDQEDSFYSEFFGRTDIDYDVDGPGSLMLLTSGDQIRLRSSTKIFANFQDLFTALSAIWCLGWGIETIGGKQKIRVEPKAHFYDKETQVIKLGRVNKLHKKVAPQYYYSQIEMGFPKMNQSGQVNGESEVNCIRRFVFPLSQPTRKLSLNSPYRSSGYEIEALRRKAGDTTDDNEDSSNFLVCLVRSGLDFVPEKNVGFVTTGIISPETSYNLRITPRQNLERWKPIIAVGLVRNEDKTLKFSYGENNYTATINGVAENAPIDCDGVEPPFWPEVYEFETPLTRSEVALMNVNKYGYIEFDDELGNTKKGFILEGENEPEAELGSFTLLRRFGNQAPGGSSSLTTGVDGLLSDDGVILSTG